MNIVYSLGAVALDGPSIFLAGPTPRNDQQRQQVLTWRIEALKILKELGFTGTVYVPEDEGWVKRPNFDKNEQRRWERKAIRAAGVVAFWMPRDMQLMPALTSNTEFGWVSGMADKPFVLGYPAETPKMSYLRGIIEDERPEMLPVHKTLRDTLQDAVARANTLG